MGCRVGSKYRRFTRSTRAVEFMSYAQPVGANATRVGSRMGTLDALVHRGISIISATTLAKLSIQLFGGTIPQTTHSARVNGARPVPWRYACARYR